MRLLGNLGFGSDNLTKGGHHVKFHIKELKPIVSDKQN